MAFRLRNEETLEWEDVESIQGDQGVAGIDGEKGYSELHYGDDAPTEKDNYWVSKEQFEIEILPTDFVATHWDIIEPADDFGKVGDLYFQLENPYNYSIAYTLNNGNETIDNYNDFDELKTFISDNKNNLTGYFKLKTNHFEDKEISCQSLFASCVNLTEIDLDEFNTSNALNYETMFYKCTNLTSIKASKLNTSNATTFNSMFMYCSSLSNFSFLENWNTSSLIDIDSMFRGTSAEEIDLSNWITNNLTSMIYTFYECYSLIKLDISSFGDARPTSLNYSFYNCTSLLELDISVLDCSEVLSAERAFRGLRSLQEFDLSNKNFEKCTNFYAMCAEMRAAKTINITNMSTPVAESFYDIFAVCYSLEEIIGLEDLYSPVVTNIRGMFWNCFAIEKIDLSSLDTSAVTSYSYMFNSCSNVTEAYGRTQEDCDLLNSSLDKPTIIKFVVKSIPYLTLESDTAFTLATANSTKNWDGDLEYSRDTDTWSTWTGTSSISSGSNGIIYLRGTGNTVITGEDSSSCRWIIDTMSNLKVTGNIENLLDYRTVLNGEHPIMGDYCYAYMFVGCNLLTIAPELPATTLAYSCYYYMFYLCISLVASPELPATTLVSNCYNSMFRGCSSLTTASELPATTLAEYCYMNMFNGCRLLKVSNTYDAIDYPYEWRLPATGTILSSSLTSWNSYMLESTGGTYTSTPSINTTYYTSTEPVVASSYSITLQTLGITPAETEEEQKQQLIDMGVEI